jgi:hypothetical protein
VDGGSGVDFLVGDDESITDLLKGKGKEDVSNVEVFIRGKDVNNLTDLGQLAKIGISVSQDGKGVTLDSSWTRDDSQQSADGYTAYTNGAHVVEVPEDVAASTAVMVEEVSEGQQ